MAATLVFDLGGVVLRWQPAELLRACHPGRLLSIDEASRLASQFFESFRPGGAWAEFDRGSLSVDAVTQRIASRTGWSTSEVSSVIRAIPDHLQLREDTAGLIGQLKLAGHRLVYLSNMPRPFVGHVQRQLDSLVAFEQGIYSSDVQLVKPEAGIFRLALHRFGCQAADCVFFDDSLVNVEAANRAGWRALHFTDAARAQQDLIALRLMAG